MTLTDEQKMQLDELQAGLTQLKQAVGVGENVVGDNVPGTADPGMTLTKEGDPKPSENVGVLEGVNKAEGEDNKMDEMYKMVEKACGTIDKMAGGGEVAKTENEIANNPTEERTTVAEGEKAKSKSEPTPVMKAVNVLAQAVQKMANSQVLQSEKIDGFLEGHGISEEILNSQLTQDNTPVQKSQSPSSNSGTDIQALISAIQGAGTVQKSKQPSTSFGIIRQGISNGEVKNSMDIKKSINLGPDTQPASTLRNSIWPS